MGIGLRFQRAGLLLLLGAAATGCASVQVSVPGMSEKTAEIQNSSERVELTSAVSALSTETAGMDGAGRFSSLMFGRGRAQSTALTSYLDGLDGAPAQKVSEVVSDADFALAKARRVAEAGRQAAHAISPMETDIDVLEAAIGDVRECRKLYTGALEQLARDGAPVTRDDIRVIHDAFSKTISDIGYTADVVASRVRATRDQSNLAATRSGHGAGGF
ncbi:MAG: hypothetical protein ACWA5T_06525 [Parvularcula sp.]